MRSMSVLMSFVTCRVLVPFAQAMFTQAMFAQAMPECHPLVEHEAFAAPAALRLRHLFQIHQDAALEVVDLSRCALAFSQRMPPVQNIAIRRCCTGSSFCAAKSLNWP